MPCDLPATGVVTRMGGRATTLQNLARARPRTLGYDIPLFGGKFGSVPCASLVAGSALCVAASICPPSSLINIISMAGGSRVRAEFLARVICTKVRSSQVARIASLRSAPVRSAQLRIAPSSLAPLRSAPPRSVLVRFARPSFASRRFAPRRSARRRSARAEICLAEICLAEVCQAEVCVAQACPAEVRFDLRMICAPLIPLLYALLKDAEMFFVGHSVFLVKEAK